MLTLKLVSVSGVKRPRREAVFSPVSDVRGDERLEKYTPGALKGMVCRAAARPEKINLKKTPQILYKLLYETLLVGYTSEEIS